MLILLYFVINDTYNTNATINVTN